LHTTPIHWVAGIEPHRIGLMARPRGGEQLAEEVDAWKLAGVDVVVSLLEPREARDLDLADERLSCERHGIVFRNLPIADRGTPSSRKDFVALIDALAHELEAGRAVAIHCRAGIGRTGIVAACLLSRLGVPMRDLFRRLSRSRGLSMPDTSEQINWVENHIANIAA
jgi:protein-tyrosine phosphatase